MLDIAFAHFITQTEVQGKVRDALIDQLKKVGLGIVTDPDADSVDQYGLPVVSPLNAPMVVNDRTIGEVDELLAFLNSSSKERETASDPLLSGGDL